MIRVDIDREYLLDLFIHVCGVARKKGDEWIVACTDDVAPRCMSEFEIEVRGFGTLRRAYRVVAVRGDDGVSLRAFRIPIDFVNGRTLRFCSCALSIILRDIVASEVVRDVAV